MISLLSIFAVLFVGFLAAVALIAWWALRVTRAKARHDQRDVLIGLAAQAAGDDGGRALLVLLRALEHSPPGGPVTVGWLPRRTAKDDAPGFLLKISWDGNEWRRAVAPGELRTRLAARIDEDPTLDGPRARQLLADLAAAEG